MYKHYIRLNEKKHIIKAFSTAFEQPEENDILVKENAGRHYNPIIHRTDGLYKFKYIDGEWVVNTDSDLTEELASLIQPDYDAELIDNITNANTFEELKMALIGNSSNSKAKVKANKK